MIVDKLPHDTFYITLNTPYVPKAVNDAAYKLVTNRALGFGQLGADVIDTFRKFAEENGVTLGMLLSLRRLALKGRVIRGYSRIQGQIKKIAHEYTSGASILELSSKYDFPPPNLLHSILLSLGHNKTELYAVFNEHDPKTLKEADQEQFKLALSNDADSVFDQRLVGENAQKFEDDTIAELRAEGIRLKTQESLAAAQMETHGRAVITPDAVFLSRVFINGVRVHWLDVKDFYYFPGCFFERKLKEQAAKYHAVWGMGVLYFHDGVSVEGGEEFKTHILVPAPSDKISEEKIE